MVYNARFVLYYTKLWTILGVGNVLVKGIGGRVERVLSESRIIAEDTDYADFKVCMRQGFGIKWCWFFCLNARRIWANTPQIADYTEDIENAERRGVWVKSINISPR